jgi:hypothetical protein
MSRAISGLGPDQGASACGKVYASYDQWMYAGGRRIAAGARASLRGRAAAGRARGSFGPPGILARAGVRRRISVHGQIVDCGGVLTFIGSEPPTFWLMYDVCALLSVLAGALLGLLA